MKKITIVFLFCYLNYFESSSQDFQWVRKFDGSYFSGENGSVIEVDNDENSYTFGMIYEPIFDIDPTSGTQIIDNSTQSTSQQCSLFLSKLDVNGNFIWGKTFGHIFSSDDKVIDIEIGSDGNINLLADIREQTTFMQKFITVIKLDPQGNILLTKKITNIDNPNQYDVYYSSSLALDNQNNIFITGSYKYRLKIDNINSQLNFTAGGDSFLLKMNSIGTILWGRRFNVMFTNDHYESVKIDNFQNPIVVVSNGDNQSYTNYGYNVFKVDTNNGFTLWGKFLDKQNPATFNVDFAGNIIIAGRAKYYLGSDIDVNPNSDTFLINPTHYVLWLTNNGDFLDVKKYPSLSGFPYFIFSKIEIDTYNNTYIVGEFSNAFDADPSTNPFVLSYFGGGGRDAYYIKFDTNRNFDNAFKLGDYNNNYINFYFTDFKIRNENQYYVGNFSNTADFDPTTSSYTLSTSNPFGARFTLKLGPCTTGLPNGNNSQSFCSSQNPTIANLLPNSNSIKWYNSLTSTLQLSNSTSLVDGQIYYAANQTGSCPESARLTVTVTINQTPNPPTTNNQVFCESENATISTLTANGLNIKWYSSLTNQNELTANQLLSSTNYYATQTVNNCESDRIAISVTVNSTSLPIAISPQSFCIQQNATLNSIIISGQSIKWYDALTNGNVLSNTTSLVSGTTYYASQTINTCESLRIPVTILIQDTPTPTANLTQTFCTSQNPTLSSIAVNGNAIIWYNSLTDANPLSNTTQLIDGTTYFATQTINGCESINRIAVTVDLITTLNATNYSDFLCDDLNNGTEIINLSNYNSNLISNTNNCTFEYYSSSNGANNQISSDLITNFSSYNLTLGNHIIYVRITSSNSCYQVTELELELFSEPTINILDVMPICKNTPITLNAGSNFDSYLWSNGATTQTILVSQPGNYSVTVTQNHGSITCSSTKNISVILSNIPTITSIQTQDWTNNENVIIVNTDNLGTYQYSLDGINYQSSNTFTGLSSGNYTVYVKDENNCDEVKQNVFLLMYPYFFTPNNDGNNDTWSVKSSFSEPDLTVEIYDRYGKIVKILSNNKSWDGTYNGNMMPSDDYWFVVKRKNGKEFKGHFTLKR